MFLGSFIKENPKNMFFSNSAAMAPQHMFFFLCGLLIAASSVHASIYYPCSYAGEFIPDDFDCGAYYVCAGPNEQHYFHCDVGLEYSIETSNCVIDGLCDGAGVRPPISTTERPPYTGTAPPGIFCMYPGQTSPDLYRCNLFWYCDTTMIAIPIDCVSLYYNVYTGTCDYPRNVDCTNGYRPPTTTGPHTISAAQTTSLLPTALPPTPCSGVPDELIPDPYDCSVYWLCYEGTYPTYQECPGGLYFDVDCGCCDYPNNVPCVGGVRPTASPVPPYVRCDHVGQMVADQSNCQMYYYCVDFTPPTVITHKCCAPTLRFNAVTNLCDHPDSVICGRRPNDQFSACNGL